MSKKSIAQIEQEIHRKRVAGLESKAGAIIVRFADDTELKLSSEKGTEAVSVEYSGGAEEEQPAAKQ